MKKIIRGYKTNEVNTLRNVIFSFSFHLTGLVCILLKLNLFGYLLYLGALSFCINAVRLQIKDNIYNRKRR